MLAFFAAVQAAIRMTSRFASAISLVHTILERLAICACGTCPTAASIEAADLLGQDPLRGKSGENDASTNAAASGEGDDA
ncbi:hypothetical protein [Sphingomonas sp.]|uniref:hypothetical protein n=1 Tax=Sphingomonas sp. TaxID=28214 RepID=UPI003B3BAE4F